MGPNNKSATIVMIDFSTFAETGIKKSFVVPGHLEVERGDLLTWKSEDSRADFFFPRPEVFEEDDRSIEKGETLKLTVRKDAPSGSFPYAVYTDNNDFAEGGSFPRLIIKG